MRTILSQSNQYNAAIEAGPAAGIMIMRSTSASDTQVARIWGAPTSTHVAGITPYTLTGQLELASVAFDSLTRVELASIAVGAITFRKPGTKATGTITFNSNPTDGQTVEVGVAGSTKTYTLKDGEKSTVICIADSPANFLDGKYFDIYDGPYAVRVWLNTSGGGAVAPATPSGGRLIEVAITTGFTDIQVATAVAAALEADVVGGFRASSGGTATVTVFVADSVLNTTDIANGTSGFTCTKVTDGPNSANQVLIGKTLYKTARNLAEAIIDGQGTHVGTGTTAHPAVLPYASSAYAVTTLNGTSQDVIYLRDILGCARQLGWTLTVGAAMSRTVMTGGIDGDLICEIAPGQYGAGAVVSLDSTDAVNVSESSTPNYDPIETFGRHSRLYVQQEGPGDVSMDIYAGPDVDHLLFQETLTLAADPGVVVQSAIIGPAQFVQARITSVTTDDCAVFAALVY